MQAMEWEWACLFVRGCSSVGFSVRYIFVICTHFRTNSPDNGSQTLWIHPNPNPNPNSKIADAQAPYIGSSSVAPSHGND